MTYTWTAHSGVRVESCVPRDEVSRARAAWLALTYAWAKYGLGKRSA